MRDQEREAPGQTHSVRVNPGYALFQISKALVTVAQHEDPLVREKAEKRVSDWTKVINGLVNGSLEVGSRTPVSGVPTWATLKVVTGGFATGELLAGGPLRQHERELLADHPQVNESDARRVLNGYFLTDQGLSVLQELLRSGRYEVEVPEEGALLTIAWLTMNGHAEEARNLLEVLGSYFTSLRFYPIPTQHPKLFGSRVFVQDVAHTIESLSKVKPNRRILQQKESIEIWAPLYDRMVGLFLETVVGETPALEVGQDGAWSKSSTGKFPVQGGWPCQRYPEVWGERAAALLKECGDHQAKRSLCQKPVKEKDSFAQLKSFLKRCAKNPRSLTGRDVGRIRLLLARYVSKRGTPESERCQDLRRKQRDQVRGPTFEAVAELLKPRLAGYPQDAGLDDVTPVVGPVTAEESARWHIEVGSTVPASLVRKVEHCLTETAEELVKRGLITSGESLARVLPQMTSGLRAAGLTDGTLRRLYASIYRAFRRRRSLLLLDLQKQIQIEELPWVAVIDQFRSSNISEKQLALEALRETSGLAISSFPFAILPNKLLQELRALAKTAEVSIPLVEEMAADIFMGEFTGKFTEAAKCAGDRLSGTLYSTYFGINYEEVLKMPILKPQKRGFFGKSQVNPFLKLCESRAGVAYGGWNAAVNGMIIEQQQILTTQNLAGLFFTLNLEERLGEQLYKMARHCFRWICRRQQVKVSKWHARLIVVKNTAYAWRQMIFFLSLLPKDRVAEFLVWAKDHFSTQAFEFRARFSPAVKGLTLAVEGQSLGGASRSDARRFTGWSKERHWLLS